LYSRAPPTIQTNWRPFGVGPRYRPVGDCGSFRHSGFHSTGGFAGALLLAICLAPILGVKETVPVTATAMIVCNITRVWVFRHSVNWTVFTMIFGAAVLFVMLSAVVYISLPVHVIALLLGVFLLVSVPLRRYMEKHDFKVGTRGLVLAAVPYGLISGPTFDAGMMLAPISMKLWHAPSLRSSTPSTASRTN